MDKIKAALTRKFGPLPAWAWAGIAGVALYIYQRRSGSSTSSSSASPTDLSNVPSYDENPYGIGGGGYDGGGGGGSYGGGSGPDTSGAGTSLPGDTGASSAPTIPASGGSTGPTGPTSPVPGGSKKQHTQTKSKPGSKAGKTRSAATLHKGIANRVRTKQPRTRQTRVALRRAEKTAPTVAAPKPKPKPKPKKKK